MHVIDAVIDEKIKETTKLLDTLITQRRQSRVLSETPTFSESKLVIVCRLLLEKAKSLISSEQEIQAFLAQVKDLLKIVQAVNNILAPLNVDTTAFRLSGTLLIRALIANS